MTIIIGIDMHVKNLVCEIGYGKDFPYKKTFSNDLSGHKLLFFYIENLKNELKTEDVLMGYEASGLGYTLYDRAINNGYRCAVLAPTELLRSATGFKKKTDKKDASYIYETLRGHVLAGNRLSNIWIPDKEFREDRDLVRTWFDISTKITRVKVQVQTLLKKYGLYRSEGVESWTKAFHSWIMFERNQLGKGFQISLDSLFRQLDFLNAECKLIEIEVKELSQKNRLTCTPKTGMTK